MNATLEKKHVDRCPTCRKNLIVIQNHAKVFTEEHIYCSTSCYQLAKHPNHTYQLTGVFGERRTIRRTKRLKAV